MWILGPVLMNLGFTARKGLDPGASKTLLVKPPELLTDVLVSWDRAAQLRKVAGASDLRRSSGPHKKPIATGEKARLLGSQRGWIIVQSHPVHLCLWNSFSGTRVL